MSGDILSGSEGALLSGALARSAPGRLPCGSCGGGAEAAGPWGSGVPLADTSAGADTAARFCAAATAMAAAPVSRLGPPGCLHDNIACQDLRSSRGVPSTQEPEIVLLCLTIACDSMKASLCPGEMHQRRYGACRKLAMRELDRLQAGFCHPLKRMQCMQHQLQYLCWEWLGGLSMGGGGRGGAPMSSEMSRKGS